jgi:hypothetical protein
MTDGQPKVPPKSNGQPHAATLDQKQKLGSPWPLHALRQESGHFWSCVAVSRTGWRVRVVPHQFSEIPKLASVIIEGRQELPTVFW